MLLRGQNLLGYRHYADDVVRERKRKRVARVGKKTWGDVKKGDTVWFEVGFDPYPATVIVVEDLKDDQGKMLVIQKITNPGTKFNASDVELVQLSCSLFDEEVVEGMTSKSRIYTER